MRTPRVFGWMADRGGCGYYRIKQPLDALASELGWTVDYSTKLALSRPIGGQRVSPAMAAVAKTVMGKVPPGALGWDAKYRPIEPAPRANPLTVTDVISEFRRVADELADQYDVLIGQMIGARDASTELWQHVCASDKIRTVYEIDDNVFKLHRGHWHHSHERLSGRAQAIRRCIRAADAVTCTTPALAELIEPWNRNVHVVPNHIDAAALSIMPDRGMPIPGGDLGRWPAPPGVLVGWGGSATHALDWAECWPGLQRVLRENARAFLATMGGLKPVPDMPGVLPKQGHMKWTPDMADNYMTYYARVGRYHIGLAPLERNEFNESKSYIKALEYAALGIPTIASSVPAYQAFLAGSGAGLLIERPDEWRGAINDLVNNGELRSAMSYAARDLAGRHTIQRNVTTWADVLMGERDV